MLGTSSIIIGLLSLELFDVVNEGHGFMEDEEDAMA